MTALALKDPVIIAEEGDPGEDYRALLISSDSIVHGQFDETANSQVWDESDHDYSQPVPLARALKFGQWEISTSPLPFVPAKSLPDTPYWEQYP